ncbi:hypothetical protein BOV88_01130 [Solemya velum gill symbiont]|uniref:Uncharacterized protein n=1 Tax=Solemya velum gill symbiont TaxID=2340 RepID=A0A1T2CNC4_SOVGS|nr:hypothetical protein [Solemya velum gill symbiont]OOY36224.1 hypothetical protein BOV88_01130 [Solemya velum gill symbiont]
MKMAAIRISALLFLLMLFTPAIAEFWAPVRQQFYHDTTYLTGGIGASEQEYLESKEVRQQYNLEILTASKKEASYPWPGPGWPQPAGQLYLMW